MQKQIKRNGSSIKYLFIQTLQTPELDCKSKPIQTYYNTKTLYKIPTKYQYVI